MGVRNAQRLEEIRRLADGVMGSYEMAQILGVSDGVVRKYLRRYGLPTRKPGPPSGERNPSFVCGRSIALDGYAYVRAPDGHPGVVAQKGKHVGRILEHRLVAEQALGRYLAPQEVVDHIDGLTLHNAPENLRVFACNGDHLHETKAGHRPNWSPEGRLNHFLRHRQPEALIPVDKHRQRKGAGVLRLHQILLLALRLGTDSPYLLGTSQWTSKAGIDMSDRSKIELALAELSGQWGLAQTQ